MRITNTKENNMNRKKMAVPIAILVMMVAVIFTVALPPAMADSSDVCKDSIRLYGYLNKGAGDDTLDPVPENPPYTNPIAPFFPQAEQAPEKDFVTFNPTIMFHNDNDWNNDGTPDTVFASLIKNDYMDASEKVFKRMWYEPTEWYKDEPHDATRPYAKDGVLDVVVVKDTDEVGWVPIEGDSLCDGKTLHDYLSDGYVIKPSNSDDKMGDIYAASIKQEFTYMFLDSSVDPMPATAPTGGRSSLMIPMATYEPGNGIDSFDADGNGMPDKVLIESELSLGGACFDFDNDGIAGETLAGVDPLPLTGDETLILTTEEITLGMPGTIYPQELQFFDHKINLTDVFGTTTGRAKFDIVYQGATSPPGVKKQSREFGENDRKFFRFGIENTGSTPQGPFAVEVLNVDVTENKVTLKVARMFGETAANIGQNAYWNEKQFYVDMVCYDVVAIMTDPNAVEKLKYVTFRQKLPKFDVKIPNHTQDLKGWLPNTTLPEMPPYNMNHDLVLDVQDSYSHDKMGDWPVPAPALDITYITEMTEPRFHGELKEILGEPDCYPWTHDYEGWWIDWFQTIPFEYTEFMLPTGHGLYLITTAFDAPEACYHYWDGELMDSGEDTRLKFWYDPTDGTDIYINRLDMVSSAPDLVITDVTCPVSGEISYTVKNVGGIAAGAFDVSIEATGVSETDSLSGLAAGVSATGTVAVDCVETGYTVCADSGSVVDESNEGNNCGVSGSCTCDWNTWNDNCVISNAEISNAEYYWYMNTPINGHTITNAEISMLEYQWATGDVC